MKIGAMNNPNKDIYKEITFIGENGFDFIDLTIEPTKAYSEDIDIKKVKSLARKYNLGIIGHTPWSFPVVSPVRGLRTAAYAEFSKCIKAFSELGVSLVNIHPGIPREKILREDMLRYNLEFFTYVAKAGKRHGISVMLENTPPVFNDADVFSAVFDEIPGLYLHVDVGHLNIGDDPCERLEAMLSLFRKRVRHFHFSDNHGMEDEHLPLGVGNVPWEKIVGIMKKHRYNGTITLEVFAEDKSYLLFNKTKLQRLWNKVK